MPKFSVIIPLFNKEKDIESTIESVLKQTFVDFEVLIINDGSTDHSLEVVQSIKDSRIKMFSKVNEGVSRARNFGVEKAQAPFIAFLDADDYWFPTHLETLDQLITQFQEHNWFSCAYEKKRNSRLVSPMVSPILKNNKNWYGEIEDFFINSLIDCLAWTSSVCFKKTFFLELNGFRTNLSHGEDTDLWIRAALKSNLVFSTKITAIHNLMASNRSRDVKISNRKTFNPDDYLEEEKNHKSLKKYLDLNRYALAVQSKMNNNDLLFRSYSENLNFNNLNLKQQFLIKNNRFILFILFKFQKIGEYLGIRLSSF